jgi:FkbM family methyltransferase
MVDTIGALNSRQEFEASCRARAAAVYVGDRTVLCRVLGSCLCYVDGDDSAVAPHLAMDGFWEAWNTLALARNVQPGWRVADVGANHGYFTLLLAALVGAQGRVFAVEPNPRLVSLLSRTLRVNGLDQRVTLLPYAADARDGEGQLVVPRDFSGDGSIAVQRSGDVRALPVARRRLDGVIDTPIDFLKIDTEGADYDVLNGALGLLPMDRSVSVLLEHYAPFYEDAAKPLGRLMSKGFALRYVTHDGDLVPASIADLDREPARFWDVWLTREARLA